MSEFDDFLTPTLARQLEAEQALINADPGCTVYRFELLAAGASGDLAYTLGYERFSFSMDGGPIQPITLRVTHVYRREDGEWKTVHRHADAPQPPAPSRRHIDGVSVQLGPGPRWGRIPPERQGRQR
jgi:hypothetical protein